MFTSSTKREIKQFHVLVVQRRLLFCQSNPTAFLTSSLLKIPNEGGRGGMGV